MHRFGGTRSVVKPAKFLLTAAFRAVAIGLALTGAYAAAGFYLAPYLIRAELLPRASATLGTRLAAEAVEFDPFAFTLTLRGVSLKDGAGEALLGLAELSADLDGRESLRQRKAVLSARLVAPSLRLAREADGKLNVMALIPPDDGRPDAAPALPFLVARLVLEQGRIEFRDAAGKKPFAAVFDAVGLTVENFDSKPDGKASFSFAAKSAAGESLSVNGTFSLAPFVSEGTLEMADLAPAPWLEYLAPESSWRFRAGKAGGKAAYLLRTGGAGDETVLDLRTGEWRGEGLELAAQGDGDQWLKIAALSLGGLSYAATEQRLTLNSVEARETALPSLKIAALSVGKLSYALAEQRLTLGSAEVRETVAPSLTIASLSTEGLSYALAEQHLTLDTAEAREAAAPWLKIAALSAGKIDYSLAEQRLKLDSAALREAVALGSPESADGEDDAASGPEAEEGAPKPQAGGRPDSGKHKSRDARVGTVQVSNLDCSLQRRSVAIGTVVSDQAEIDVRLTGGGSLKVRGLPAFGPAAGEKASKNAEAPWTVRVGEARLSGYALGFRDDTVAPPVRLNFAPASLRLTDFTTEPGRQFQFRLNTGVGEKGRIEVDGQARLAPLQSEIRFGVDKLWLRSLQSYWDRLVGFNLVKGRLNLWGDLTVRQEANLALDYSGAADLVDLATVDKREGKDFIRWGSLKFDGLVVGTRPKRVSIRSVTAGQPYARVFIAADRRLNLTRDLMAVKADPEANAPKTAPPPRQTPRADRWPVVIGTLRVADGRMDFADLTLKPNFAVEIQHLNGNVRGLSSQENAKADLFLEGRINQSSPVKIFGHMNPASFGEQTDIAMEFRGVNLTTLSPYSGKFAGYRIEKGKLDMDLRYNLRDRALTADNRVVLDHLVLGERVDSPTATSLPVDLAVALLKDSNGQIDIDLPVSGNLDDPEFSLRNLYASAATQMLTKLIGSPFSLLGSLIQDGGEELGYVKFQAGNAALEEAEKRKLGQVATALKERPELNLDVKGSADPQQDRMALAESALLKQLLNARLIELRTLGEQGAKAGGPSLSDDDYQRLFTRYYRQRYPGSPELQALETGQQPVLNGPLLDQAKRKVLEQWAVNELDLRLLAQARGEIIRDYLVREAGLPDKRIYLLDVNLAQPDDREIKTFLSLSGS
jgi:hypothetical protein